MMRDAVRWIAIDTVQQSFNPLDRAAPPRSERILRTEGRTAIPNCDWLSEDS